MITKTPMKAIVYRQLGSPNVLRLEDWPSRPPGKEEVLVRQETWGVNFVGVLMGSWWLSTEAFSAL